MVRAMLWVGAQHHASQSIGRNQQSGCRGHPPSCRLRERDGVGLVASGLFAAV